MARSASGPSAVIRSLGSADISKEGVGTAAPMPPNLLPSVPARSSMTKCRRAGASTNTVMRVVLSHIHSPASIPPALGLLLSYLPKLLTRQSGGVFHHAG